MTSKTANQQNTFRLSIQVRLDGLSFFIQNVETNEVITYLCRDFETNFGAQHIHSYIKEVLRDQKVLEQSYSTVTVVYANNLYTLVPNSLFDPDKLTDYLKFNTRLLSTDFVSKDSIDSVGAVNVFIPYNNVNNYFLDAFGTFTYHHNATVFIEGIMSEGLALEHQTVCIHVQKEQFDLVAFHQGKLTLVNTFHYRSPEDFIYYLLFAIEQLEYNRETLQLYLTGAIDTDSQLYKMAYTYIREVDFLNSRNEQIDARDYLLSTLAL